MKQHKKLIIAVLLLAMSIIGISVVYADVPQPHGCPKCYEQTYYENGRIYTQSRDAQFECSNCGFKGHAYDAVEVD